MLQVATIREHKDHIIERLAVRNFANAEAIISQVLTADEKRKKR